MITVVMTYYNRQYQLDRTLDSLDESPYKEFNVVVVDDCSPDPPIVGNHSYFIKVLRTENKRWIDGSPAYNLGFIEAIRMGSDIIVIQNAETYHVGDVLSRAATVAMDSYTSFACFNLSRQDTFSAHNIHDIINKHNYPAVNNDDNAWFNHKWVRPMGYHFCSAIRTENLIKINGFDERFADGYCFEDDEILARIRHLGLKVEITDHPFVVHQYHERGYVPANWKDLFFINGKRFEMIKASGNPVAVHRFTPDLNEI
jgi:glycosyltransferase involved in cell wall biosynthesis